MINIGANIFYFIYENEKLDLQDSFIREEINVFLSCLK